MSKAKGSLKLPSARTSGALNYYEILKKSMFYFIKFIEIKNTHLFSTSKKTQTTNY